MGAVSVGNEVKPQPGTDRPALPAEHPAELIQGVPIGASSRTTHRGAIRGLIGRYSGNGRVEPTAHPAPAGSHRIFSRQPAGSAPWEERYFFNPASQLSTTVAVGESRSGVDEFIRKRCPSAVTSHR